MADNKKKTGEPDRSLDQYLRKIRVGLLEEKV